MPVFFTYHKQQYLIAGDLRRRHYLYPAFSSHLARILVPAYNVQNVHAPLRLIHFKEDAVSMGRRRTPSPHSGAGA